MIHASELLNHAAARFCQSIAAAAAVDGSRVAAVCKTTGAHVNALMLVGEPKQLAQKRSITVTTAAAVVTARPRPRPASAAASFPLSITLL
jgi:hypothetical protein